MFRSGFLALVVFGLLAIGADAQPQQAKVATPSPGSHELPPWLVPDIASLPDDENGKLVRYGKDLIDHTWALIGPQAPDAARRYTGNGLACTNCHIDSAPYAMPCHWSASPACIPGSVRASARSRTWPTG